MVFQLNDFTDSEEESSSPPASTPRRAGPSGRNARATPSSPADHSRSARVSASPRSARERDHARGPSATSSSGHPLRITLRTAPPQPADAAGPSIPTRPSAPTAASQRSSLSPPPPITLKLSRQSLAEKATYSSSEEDAVPPPIYYAEDDVEADRSYAPKAKKAAKRPKSATTPRKASTSTTASLGASVFGGAPVSGPSVPAPSAGGGGKKKTYDWLAPSAVSASHPAPHHAKGGKKSQDGSTGAREDSEMELDLIVADDTAPPVLKLETGKPAKKKVKRVAGTGDTGLGPGRNWRKGQGGKKIKALLAESHLDAGSHDPSSPNYAGVMSVDGTPEPLDLASREGQSYTRGNTPPFERADPAKLGFPVFARPIVASEFSLGSFPRVTQFFAPVNGGDAGPFPRKEKVRSWKHHTSTLRGIAGGTLMYKAWARGLPSELGRLVQADREAKEIQRAAKKAGANALPIPSAPLFNDSALAPDARPGLQSTVSSDSVFQLQATQGDEAEGSELGDVGADERSVSGDVAAAGAGGKVGKAKAKAPAKKRVSAASAGGAGAGPSKPKAKPRKSKLAQEIVPVESAEPVEVAAAE